MEEKLNAVARLSRVVNVTKKKKLANLNIAEKEAAPLKEYLEVSPIATILFAAIFDRACSNNETDLSDLADYFNCSTMDILAKKQELDELVSSRLILTGESNIRDYSKVRFRINPTAFDCIIDNSPILLPETCSTKYDKFDFIREIGDLVESRIGQRMSSMEMFSMISRIENKNNSISVVAYMKGNGYKIEDRILFYDCCFDYIKETSRYHASDLETTLNDIIDRDSTKLSLKKELISETSQLLRNGLIEFWKDDDKYCLEPSDKGKEIFLEEDYCLYARDESNLDKYEFVKAVAEQIQARDYQNYPSGRLFRSIENLEKKNKKLPLVKKSGKILSKIEDRVIFYDICACNIDGNSSLDSIINDIYDSNKSRFRIKQEFKTEAHKLQTSGLVELGKESFFGSGPLELTEAGRELFFEKDIQLIETKMNKDSIITPEQIKEKHLYYSAGLDRNVRFLRDSLSDGKYEELRKRLSDKALPSGIAAIFYGSPGTGKTETVYQIAKATGREIFRVDISEMKTCWYGESQKLVKGVFRQYASLSKKNRRTPILLFNEADAIFGKRSENPEHSVDKTDNAIQNIILEEMEKLDGILIATTNLEQTLDPAFERRFLFKINFERPDSEAMKLIWKDKMPSLTDSDAGRLAERFDFSGGEIDNIIRKSTMNEILNGESPDIEYLVRLCSEERFSREVKSRKIGF